MRRSNDASYGSRPHALLAGDTSDPANAEDVFIWGLALVLFGRYLDIAVKAGVPLNQFVLSPDLATPKTKALGAQVDTLYGLGWIDLGPGAQVIEVPDTAGRYYSIQLLDAYQNPLSGTKRYRLRFSAGQLPPVNAFWSVGVYTKDYFFYDNSIHRYSITDRTAGLRTGSDGALDLFIQHEPPADGPSNWLPTPSDRFAIVVRAYEPTRAILNKQYQLPPLDLI